MRLYFTCPIQALYMMKEFDVVIQNDMVLKEQLIKYANGEKLSKTVYPVHVESEQIFEPKAKDLILHTSRESEDDAYELWAEDIGSRWLEMYFDKIIMRDNKHFFQARKEAE